MASAATARQLSHRPDPYAILKSVHGYRGRNPLAARARRVGERLAAARRSGHADRHRAARRRRSGGARGRPARAGLRVEDIELLLATHHHLDHVGLAATIQRRSGAAVAVLDRMADYAARYSAEVEEDRRFARALMTHHGVPDQVVADTEEFWDYIRATTEDFRADVRLADGDRVRAGGRDLRVVARPGHSTTDTLFVDDRDAIAFAGDHLLATISSNTEIRAPDRAHDGRARSRVRYLESLERTKTMPLARLLTGHGAPVTEHGRLVDARLRDHRRRCERIVAILDDGPHGVRDRRRAVAGADGAAAAAARRLGGGRQPRAAAGLRRGGRAGRRPRLGVRADGRRARGAATDRARRPRRRAVPDCAGRR